MSEPTPGGAVWTRRAFLIACGTAVGATANLAARPNTARVVPGRVSPNERLNIACIGCGGMGEEDIGEYLDENIVALCDVDPARAQKAYRYLVDVPKFTDWRRMLDEAGAIEAVSIATPDHTHAVAAYAAMQRGKHVYVQKPMTQTIAEAQLLTDYAAETGLVTQMGNQGHSLDDTRELCEMVWSGAIGEVTEVHAWTYRPAGRWPQGIAARPAPTPAPETLDWDLWLSVAAPRPYSEAYAPRNWRGWYDFGAGALGDMACHVLDGAWWALRLDAAPRYSVEIVDATDRNAYSFPTSQVLRYRFPARAGMGPVDVYWYDGANLPPWPQGLPRTEELGDGGELGANDGAYFVGSEGLLTHGTYGNRPHLLPVSRMEGYTKPEPSLPRVHRQNHYKNWVAACKGAEEASSPFSYAGPFTVMVLLGAAAMRAGTPLTWNAERQQIEGDAALQVLASRTYREGWALPV